MHLPHLSFGLLNLNMLIFDIIVNTAPKGHKYLQKNLSIKKAPIVIKSRSIKPIVKVDKTLDISVICAKASQGLVPSHCPGNSCDKN